MVTGVPTIYENKQTHQKQLQIVIDRASQIRRSPVPGLSPPLSSVAAPAPGTTPSAPTPGAGP